MRGDSRINHYRRVPSLLLMLVALRVASAIPIAERKNDPAISSQEVRQRKRQLLMEDFVPLSCNHDLLLRSADDDNEDCVSWTEQFGNATEFIERVIIECGTCVTMVDLFNGNSSSSNNNNTSFLTLHQGIDIRGKLVVDVPSDAEEGHTLQLQTASITVQGELEMHATQAIDGKPRIHVQMIGTDIQAFEPVGENAEKCSSNAFGGECQVGRKAITVAGGRINIQGINSNAKTWVRLIDVVGGTENFPTSIIVEALGVRGHWLPGAEILITSHTRLWNDHQVRRIVSVADYAAEESYVQLDLDEAIRRPTTHMESADFAVEVALLSRNVVFEGGSDPHDGGHLWIRHTPSVIQTIIGVAIVKFGQAGRLGKYPLHFHHCSDASGSVVAKNTIRQSHQRCVVIHGTNNVLVEDNVAFQTAGHCFMTEDGIETGNSFARNLGAETRVAAAYLPAGSTDDKPATFWISNPTNFVEGNVAAGSSGSGFWYELKKRGPLKDYYPDPRSQPLGSFVDNVAHSNGNSGQPTGSGAVRMYPTGYLPNGSTREIFVGLKAYRNIGIGVFLHKMINFDFTDALVSDNDIGIDLDRAEDINVSNTTIIGMSNSYSDLMRRESDTDPICGSQGMATGIELHSWKFEFAKEGFNIQGVDILGYDHIDCGSKSAIRMDPFSLKQSGFETYTTFSDVTVFDGPKYIDLCDAAASGMVGVYLVDLDGSLSSKMDPLSTSGSIVSNNHQMTTFVDQDQCTLVEEGCYNYCSNTCFNSIRYSIEQAGTEKFKLKVCLKDDPVRCLEVQHSKRHDVSNPYGDFPRPYLVHVPPGSYNAVFLDESGNETLPSYVIREEDAAFCNEAVDLNLILPPQNESDCLELVQNGDAELSSSDPVFWLTAFARRLELAKNAGVGGSNALTGNRFGHARFLQYINTRCLTENTTFRVTAKTKLMTEGGDIVSCDLDAERCPYVGIHVDGVGDLDIAEVQLHSGTDKEGFQSLDGVFKVDANTAKSDRVYVFVDWADQLSSVFGSRKLFADEVSMVPVPFIQARSAPGNPPSRPPTKTPTHFPSAAPSTTPSMQPSSAPTDAPGRPWTKTSTHLPSAAPSPAPSTQPSSAPGDTPSRPPTKTPTHLPSAAPSTTPSMQPSAPSRPWTKTPTHLPSAAPSPAPSTQPSSAPTDAPSRPWTKTPTHLTSAAPSPTPSTQEAALIANGECVATAFCQQKSTIDNFLSQLGFPYVNMKRLDKNGNCQVQCVFGYLTWIYTFWGNECGICE